MFCTQKISSFSSFLRAGARDAGAERYSALLEGLSSPDDSDVLINVQVCPPPFCFCGPDVGCRCVVGDWQELVNMLLHAANEEALAGLDAGKFVPVLLNLLNYEHNGEIMLLAVRCLCQMMDQMPRSTAAMVGCGAVEAFCNKLIMITYVDVAEECIKGERVCVCLDRHPMLERHCVVHYPRVACCACLDKHLSGSAASHVHRQPDAGTPRWRHVRSAGVYGVLCAERAAQSGRGCIEHGARWVVRRFV